MDEDIQRDVNPNSAEFRKGVEAGSNSTEGTKKWQAGFDLGQELKDENGEMMTGIQSGEPAVPLFMRSSPELNQGNAQDEKDETAE